MCHLFWHEVAVGSPPENGASVTVLWRATVAFLSLEARKCQTLMFIVYLVSFLLLLFLCLVFVESDVNSNMQKTTHVRPVLSCKRYSANLKVIYPSTSVNFLPVHTSLLYTRLGKQGIRYMFVVFPVFLILFSWCVMFCFVFWRLVIVWLFSSPTATVAPFEWLVWRHATRCSSDDVSDVSRRLQVRNAVVSFSLQSSTNLTVQKPRISPHAFARFSRISLLRLTG